jgi:peptide/nickel transport system permease protein
VTAYVVRRLLYTIPLVLGVALIVWLIFDSGMLGDPATKLLGKNAKPKQVELLRKDLGLDDPAYERYGRFVKGLATFEFGRSRQYHTRITEMIVRGVGPSLSLTVPAFFLATLIAVSLSLFCAAFRGGLLDRSILVTAVALMSISSLVYIIFGQYVVAYRLELAPIAGFRAGPAGIAYLWLPIVIFVFLSIGPDLRFYRTAMLEEVKQDYVRTARAKGVSENKILFVHVLRNGLIPVLTRVIVVLPFLFTGALLLEKFFQIPGIGGMVVYGIIQNDMPVLKAMTFIFALLFIVANLLTDILYTVVDPRVRLS